MASPYICSTCRTQLLLQRPRSIRVLSRSAYTKRQHGQGPSGGIGSLFEGDEGPARSGQPGHNGISSSAGRGARGRYSGKELRPEELLGQLDDTIQSPRRPPQRRPIRPQYTESTGIQQSTHSQKRSTGARPSRVPPPVHQAALRFVDLARSQSFAEAWTVLQDIAPQPSQGNWRDALPLFRVDGLEPGLRHLLFHTTTQWLDGIASNRSEEAHPTPVDIFTLLQTLGTSKTSFARPVLWRASSGLAELHSHLFSTNENSPAFVNGVRSLVNMWRISMATYLKQSSNNTISPNDSSGWSFLPSATVFDQQVRRSHETFEQMLGMLVPMPQSSRTTHMDPRRASTDYASSALVTLHLLRSVARSSPTLLSEPDLSPFVNLLETMLKNAPAPHTPFSFQEKLSDMENPTLRAYYKDMGNALNLKDMRLPSPTESTQPIEAGDLSPTTAESPARAEDAFAEDDLELEQKPDISQTDRFALINAKRLSRALEQQDMLLAEKIKRESYAFAGSHGTNALPLELYEHLMLTFLSLRNAKTAIEIWNYVIRAGYKPTVKTYTTMMRGAQNVRDVGGMNAFWQKMKNAGLQPDEHAWSVRIYGLFKMQLIKAGFQAMNEMSQEWLAAAKARALREATREQKKQMAISPNLGGDLLARYTGPVDGVPRPDLVVVNSAISSLAQSQRGDIPRALTWGRTFGVEPDVTTYNVLLNVAMRYEQTDEALNILRRMQQRGVAANSTTWTVLLTALFEGGFMEGLNHKQQQEKVLGFINALETVGPSMPGIDSKGYALVIDRLLKHYDNPDGGAAVVKHMLDQGLQPTTHIYTILVGSYFQRQPQPDLAAVQALWKQIESQNSGYGAPVDSVFYDRMIEGYATHHRLATLQPALGFLRRCRQAGQKPGWRALEAVARALQERQEWNRLKALVDDVRASLRESRGASQHMGQRNFWRFIIEDVGLLKEEGVTKPEDILPNNARRSPLLQAEASAEAQ